MAEPAKHTHIWSAISNETSVWKADPKSALPLSLIVIVVKESCWCFVGPIQNWIAGGVIPDDNNINVLVSGLHPRQGESMDQVDVEIQGLSKLNIQTLAGPVRYQRSVQGSLQADLISPDGVQDILRYLHNVSPPIIAMKVVKSAMALTAFSD